MLNPRGSDEVVCAAAKDGLHGWKAYNLSTRVTWDATKAAANWRKHRVTFEEATSAIEDALAISVPDREHSIWECRFLTIGMSARGRLLAVAQAENGDVITTISARLATKSERLHYEQGY